MRASEEDDEQFYRDTERIAFPALSDEQLATLDSLGTRRKVRRGEIIYKAGQRDVPFNLVLSGAGICKISDCSALLRTVATTAVPVSIAMSPTKSRGPGVARICSSPSRDSKTSSSPLKTRLKGTSR